MFVWLSGSKITCTGKYCKKNKIKLSDELFSLPVSIKLPCESISAIPVIKKANVELKAVVVVAESHTSSTIR